MDYYDPANPDFATQEQQLLQAAARIKALRGMTAPDAPEMDPGFTSAVTGTKILGRQPKQNILGALTPLIAGYTADKQEQGANEARTKLTAAEQAHLAGWLKGQPQDTEYSATPLPGNTGGVGGNLVEADVTPAHTVTPQERADWYASGMKGGNPLVKEYADKGIEEELFGIPKEARALKVAMAKQAAEERQKELDRQARIKAAEVKAANSGGEKGSDFQIFQNDDGTLTKVNKITGAREELGSGGRKAAGVLKQEQEQDQTKKNAAEGLKLVDDMEKLFSTAQTSGATNIGQAGRSFFTGKTTPEQDALSDLKIMASKLAQFADRKMFGPQFTEADVKAIKESMGALDRPTSVSERATIAARLREIFQRQLAGGATAAASGQLKQISGDADYDALPPGARFIDPEGKPRIKPGK